ncbi:MAG: class I SAM-dependent methyltransferase [Acidobacteriales bacterium]|nr:class I SAM-dependent methyltransferase [Terriglobales bacterium]
MHTFDSTILYRCAACGFWFCCPLIVNLQLPSAGPSSIVTDEGYSDRILRTTARRAERYVTLARRRYRSYCELLGRSTFSMLDIGCESGELGSEFLKLGVDYHGVNIDTRIVEAGQRRVGDRINRQDFLEMEVDRKYDIVCFHQVLEHITTPFLFARKVREFTTAPGGAIHGDVPNVSGLSALVHRLVPLNRHRFGAIELPHHQFAYEVRTIQRLFAQDFSLDIFDVRINDPTWGQVIELGCILQVYSAVSGALNTGTNLAFVGKRISG